MINSSISTPCCVNHGTGNHSPLHWLDVAIQLTYIKSIDMVNKNTQVQKKRGQVGSTSWLLFIHSTKKCDI